MERVRTDDRAGGTGTGGAFTGGLTVEVDVGCCLRLTGAALYRTGWLDDEVAFGGVTGDLAGEGSCGVRAFALLLLALLVDRERCLSTLRCESLRKGGTLSWRSFLSSFLSS